MMMKSANPAHPPSNENNPFHSVCLRCGGFAHPWQSPRHPPSKCETSPQETLLARLAGQICSLASDERLNPVRPLDFTGVSGAAIASDKITINLRPITHPSELPPITMMNWLVLLEELRR